MRAETGIIQRLQRRFDDQSLMENQGGGAVKRVPTGSGSCPNPGTNNFLRGRRFKLRYAPRWRIPGWSVRNMLVDQCDNKPISFKYICPFCGYLIDGRLYAGWKHCICPDCKKESDFTVTLNSPYGYFYGVGICEDKELFDDGYFEWVSTIYNNRIPKE